MYTGHNRKNYKLILRIIMPEIPDPFKNSASNKRHSFHNDETSESDNFQSDFFQSSHFKPEGSEEEESLQRVVDARNNALIAYISMTIGIFTGIFWIIGAIWAMVKKDDAKNTLYYEHYTNLISTFWWGLLWTVIGTITWVFIIGGFILFAAWIWTIYRVIKGLALITSNKPYT